ncbi:MAG: purine-nucleoside phosphorylase [Saprospiraceae bacterium]|nr:purine-nucleoside phosphorylase [Saprospiraceae bacterium]
MSEAVNLEKAYNFLLREDLASPTIGLVLGSGLGVLADIITKASSMPYRDIPHFPQVSVEGHKGNLVFGKISGKTVVAMQGRIHYYEHTDMASIRFPIRLMKMLGIKTLIVTNACGGIRTDLYPGALMLIRDHLNFVGTNPLIGPNDPSFGPRFPDMSEPYDNDLGSIALQTAQQLGIDLSEGVYGGVSGPYYMSKVELSLLRLAGADTVGMSTVPEVIVANHCNLAVLGISCITDMAIPESLSPLTHEEVIEVAVQTRPKFIKLISAIIEKMPYP